MRSTSPDAEAGEITETLRAEIAETPEAFQQSAEGLHLSGRLFEAERRWDEALDCYENASDVSLAHLSLIHI